MLIRIDLGVFNDVGGGGNIFIRIADLGWQTVNFTNGPGDFAIN